jgi:hypothetical protein
LLGLLLGFEEEEEAAVEGEDFDVLARPFV